MGLQTKEALYLIDDLSMRNYSGLRSGWDHDDRGSGGYQNRGHFYVLNKATSDGPDTLKRDFTALSGGEMILEFGMNTGSGDGFFMSFGNADELAFRLVCRDGALFCGNEKVCDFPYGNHYLKCVIDADSGRLHIYADKKDCGKYDLLKKLDEYSRFKCGFEKEDFGVVTLFYTKLYINYLVNDKCLSMLPGEMPADYETSLSGDASVTVKETVKGKPSCSYFSTNKKGAKTITSKQFPSACGVVAFETKYLLPEDGKGIVKISLNQGDTYGVLVTDGGLCLQTSGGEVLRNHSLNVWQTLRMEADTRSKTALIKLNGKKTKTIRFEHPCECFDNIKIEYEASADSTLLFSDLFVWVIQPEPADYVPAPVPVRKSGDYYVGMNICSLWRTGDHVGWDCITPFDEIRPLMGYYDEGLPEVADWELKWMYEHGIDFELYCWYSDEENAPQKNTVLSSAIHGGHFHAKYSDKVKMALLWEAANCAHPKGVEAYKKYLVPYWLDYFFSDPRYMAIDNKAVMSVFGVSALIEDLGGVQAVKESLDYLREKVKELGYDDLIITACSDANQTVADCGFDAVHAYNWGKMGYDLEYTKKCVSSNTDREIIHVVPTVSTGFNNVGWASTRSPNMEPQDMRGALEWFKSDMLPKYDKDSWKSKLCMLSTWNEYGEGTYMCPSGLNGFGYLDAVRSAFCEDVPHTDAAPNEAQKRRLGYLHPQNRATIARLDWEQLPVQNEKAFLKWTFTSQEDLDKWELVNLEEAEIKDNKYIGNITKFDPQMILKEDLNLVATRISHARVKIRCYKPVNAMDCIQMFYSKEPRADHPMRFRYNLMTLTEPDRMAELIVPLYKNPGWNGIIRTLRFDPIYGEGYFELESIELMESVPHIEFFIDEKPLFFGLYPDEENGEVYFPFQPKSGFLPLVKAYHEWDRPNQALSVWARNKKAVFTIGSGNAQVDGKTVALKKPVYTKDGLPMIPLRVLADVLDVNVTRSGDDITLTLK